MTIETLVERGFDRPHVGLAGMDTRKLKAMRNSALRACFKLMEETRYRLEHVATIRGREYINDASARTVNATWYSFESIQGGIVWIACGTNEDIDYNRLLPLALRKVRMLLVLGDAENMKKAFGAVVPQIVECTSMAEALHHAYFYDSDDVKVLFSPASDGVATSEALGEMFLSEVNEL